MLVFLNGSRTDTSGHNVLLRQSHPLPKYLAVHEANVIGRRTHVLPVQDPQPGQEEHHFVFVADLEQQQQQQRVHPDAKYTEHPPRADRA